MHLGRFLGCSDTGQLSSAPGGVLGTNPSPPLPVRVMGDLGALAASLAASHSEGEDGFPAVAEILRGMEIFTAMDLAHVGQADLLPQSTVIEILGDYSTRLEAPLREMFHIARNGPPGGLDLWTRHEWRPR